MTATPNTAELAAIADRLLAAHSRLARSPERLEATLESIARAINASHGVAWSEALQSARDAEYRAAVRDDHAAALELLASARPLNPSEITLRIECSPYSLDISSYLSPSRESYMQSDPADEPAQAQFATREEAQAFVDLLPKSCKVRAGTISCRSGRYGYLKFHVGLTKTGTTGELNETGVKRYRTLRRALDALGVTLEWVTPFQNALTEQEAELLMTGEISFAHGGVAEVLAMRAEREQAELELEEAAADYAAESAAERANEQALYGPTAAMQADADRELELEAHDAGLIYMREQRAERADCPICGGDGYLSEPVRDTRSTGTTTRCPGCDGAGRVTR